MNGRSYLLLGLGLTGCSDVIITWPESSATSWIIAIYDENTLAMAATDGAPVRTEDDNDEFTLLALGYDVPLSNLGLEVGKVTPEEDCNRSCKIASPILQKTRRRFGDWVDVASIPETVMSALFPSRRCDSICDSFRHDYIDWPINPEVLSSEQLGTDEWILSTTTGLYRLAPPSLQPICPEVQMDQISLGGDGKLYGTLGRQSIVALDLEDCTTSTVPGLAGMLALHATETLPVELYTRLSEDPVRERISLHHATAGEPFTQIAEMAGDDVGDFFRVPPGRALYYGEAEDLAWIDHGTAEIEAFGAPTFDISSASYSETRGPVLAISKVGISVRPSDTHFGPGRLLSWVELRSGGDVFADPRGIVVLEDRVFTIAKAGALQQWVDGSTEPCPYQTVPFGGDGSPAHLLSLSDGSLIIADANAAHGSRVSMTWLRRIGDVCSTID